MARKLKKEKFRESKKIQSETEFLGTFMKWAFQAKGTMLLILIMIGMYVWSLFLSPEQLEKLIFTPASMLSLDFIPMVASWFLHADLTHLLGNIFLLFIFGRVIEKVFGSFRFLIMFFSAAIASDIVSALIFRQGGIGASGAIAGLIGAAILIRPFYLNYMLFGAPVPIVVIGWLGIFADISGLLYPVPGDNIGHVAHLAGFFVTSLWLYITTKDKKKIGWGLFVNVMTIIGAIFFYLLFPSISLRSPVGLVP